MTINLNFDNLTAYVDHRNLVASNAIAAANKAHAELGKLIQALIDVGFRVLNGEPNDLDEIESERVTRGSPRFKQINATAGNA